MFKNLKISSNKYIFFLSLYLSFVLNISFFKTLFLNFQISGVMQFLCVAFLIFIVPLPIYLFLNLILLKSVIKPLSYFILILSSATNYMMLKMGVYIDYSMIRNVFETNTREALDLISLPLIINVMIFGIVPSIFVAKLKITFYSFKQEVIKRLCMSGISIFLIIIYLLLFGKFLVPFGRNNSEIKAQYNTLNYVVNTLKYINKSLKTPKKFIILDDNVKSKIKDKNVHIVVLVVGETARAQNFSLYGYKKETNPLMKNEANIVAVPDVTSCGTATALSVPCMFSAKKRSDFDIAYSGYEENLLDIVKKAGWNVVWYENDDGCKKVCNRVESYNIVSIGNSEDCFGDFCRDNALISYLENNLKNADKNTMIVLHTMGSHGPSYYKRYSKEFEKFKPACDTINIQNCSEEELVNTYDNTILYTDYFVSKVIEKLKQYKNYETSLLYVSDHGESLGEGGIYLHGLPYRIAPKEQKTVPFIMWFSDSMLKNTGVSLNCLKNKVWKNISHDNLFHTMLGLTKTDTKLYNQNLDVIFDCEK